MTQLQEEISPQTLKELRQSRADLTLVDVRDPWELEICRIEGCINLPLPQLAIQMPDLDKDAAIVLYCHHGIRSRNAVLILQQKGFRNVASLKGGIEAWSQQIDANVPVY
jgi:rhodanese-related sulfurtransferase